MRPILAHKKNILTEDTRDEELDYSADRHPDPDAVRLRGPVGRVVAADGERQHHGVDLRALGDPLRRAIALIRGADHHLDRLPLQRGEHLEDSRRDAGRFVRRDGTAFDVEKDFTPVALLGRFEFAVVTGPGTNAADFSQLVTWLRANTAKAAYGIPSNGTIPHFAGTRIEAALNMPMTRVPYRGGAAVVKDVIGGHLPFAVITVSDALPSHQAGSVRIVAVSSEKRSPYLPDVPTLKESGVDLLADSWYGMWLPAGASPDFARQLSAAVVTVLAKPAVKDRLLAIGLIPAGTTPERLTQELAANTAFWRPIVQATGYKITN
jgi:hypothetical protein